MSEYRAGYRAGYVEGKVKVGVYIDPEVQQALRIRAAQTGESMSGIAERALRRELGLMMDRATVRMTPSEAWDGFVGSQGVHEFLVISRDKGHPTPKDAVAAYLDESYDDLTHDIENPISRDTLEDLLLRYVEANMPLIEVEAYQTTYTDAAGRTHEAILLPWHVVEDILGHEHTGAAEEDNRLIDALRASGAPDWVQPGVPGWVDEHGWGLIGPVIEEDDQT